MILECKNLSFGYDGKTVISDINFSVNKGDYLCIVGENGSGKSTLLKGLLRLKSPSAGDINFGFKRFEAGYLPQQSLHRKDFPASVGEVVLSGTVNRMGIFHTAANRKKAAAAMERMNISELKNQCFRELSGGQMQRALLARALCSADKLLVLDEPVSGLDPLAAEEMYSLISEENKRGMTVITVSHDIAHAAKCATHILHLGEKQMFFGTKEEYKNSPTGKYFLGGAKA